MKRAFVIALLLVIGSGSRAAAQQAYKPAEVTSAEDAYVPYQVVTDGLFVLDVSLNKSGGIQKIDALRDPGAMFGAAKTSVEAWTFQPALQGGQKVPSRITLSFVYRPPSNGGAGALPPKDFSPILPTNNSDNGEPGGYVPVGIVSFDYPTYPVNSVSWGSVVVQLTIDEEGNIAKTAFLHSMGGFNDLVSEALKKWRFQTATFDGKPIRSKTVIAFVFQTPTSNSN